MKPLLLLLTLLSLAFATYAQSTQTLSLNQSLEGTMTADGRDAYLLPLEANFFVYGEAYQHEADVIVTVIDPDGELVATFDNSGLGIDGFQFETSKSGNYQIEISPFRESTGRYSVAVKRAESLAKTPEGKIDQLMAQYEGNRPGGAIAVTHQGKTVFAKGYGQAQLEYEIPNTPQTVYHMASVSKQFTAFAIVMLAEQGKLNLDDEVQQHLPSLPDFGPTITLRHLLNHTSGIRDHWLLWVLAGGRMDDVIRQEDIRRLLEHQTELNFQPGEEYLYSNSGFMLLSEVVTAVTEVPFGEWMQQNVFEPLGMKNTQIYDDHERIVANRAYSYRSGNPGYRKAVLSYANSGATSLFTTAEDMLLWIRNFHDHTVGSEAVHAQLLERGILNNGDTLNYALGIDTWELKGLQAIGHGGADAGFRSFVAYYPEIDAGVVVMGNVGYFNPRRITDQVTTAFFEKYQEKEGVEPSEPEKELGMTLGTEVLDRYVGEYLMESGETIRFFREGQQFRIRVNNEFTATLTPLSDTTFQVQSPGPTPIITFTAEADGSFKRGQVEQEGIRTFERIVPWTPDEEELATYVGTYYSAELETFYHVRLEEDKLVGFHLRHGEFEMTPQKQDVFRTNQWFLDNLQFVSDENGTLTEMLINGGRVRNLRLSKM